MIRFPRIERESSFLIFVRLADASRALRTANKMRNSLDRRRSFELNQDSTIRFRHKLGRQTGLDDELLNSILVRCLLTRSAICAHVRSAKLNVSVRTYGSILTML